MAAKRKMDKSLLDEAKQRQSTSVNRKRTQSVIERNLKSAASCRRPSATILIMNYHLLILLLATWSSLALTHQLVSGHDPRNSNIVFPTEISDSDDGHHHHQQNRLPRQSAADNNSKRAPKIYINPQPSTLSGKYNSQDSSLKSQRQSDSFAGNSFYQPPIGSRPAAKLANRQPQTQQQQQQWPGKSAAPLGSAIHSSIGKSEQSQVAEWPFVKSFQMARNQINQMSGQQYLVGMQASPSTTLQPTTVALTQSGEQPALSGASTTTEAPVVATTTTRAPPEEQTTTTTTTTTTSTTTTTTTVAPTTATAAAPEESEIDDGKMGMNDETTTSTSTTTTPTPSQVETTTTTQRPPAPPADALLREQMMIPARVHSSIQSAVDRLVEMGARAAANQIKKQVAAEDSAANATSQQVSMPQIVRVNGNSNRLKSSLSLNVLLKNFGALNLTSLDQILLKSSLNQPGKGNFTPSLLTQLPRNHQKIEINGIHHLEQPLDGEQANQRPTSGLSASDERNAVAHHQQQAECKIEYTMKHVNISLANDDRSDYTCDYIIDRKSVTTGGGNVPLDEFSNGKFCRLHLRSDFFSNETSGGPDAMANGEGQQDEVEKQICAGMTYLAIGRMKFCHRERDSATQAAPSLDRIFSFPVEREAFDIRLVHRTAPKSSKLAPSGDESSGGGEVHLEIKPIVDKQDTCQALSSGSDSALESGAHVGRRSKTTTRKPLLAKSTIGYATDENEAPKLSTTKRPSAARDQAMGTQSADVVPLQNGSPASGANKRKAVVKLASGGVHPHPINHHHHQQQQTRPKHPKQQQQAAPNFSTSQTFDVVDSASPTASPIDDTPTSAPSLCGAELAEGEFSASAGVHVATSGQITTPNYPSNYTSNTHCRHIIKRVSRAHCKLLLHFRDFDLTPGPQPGAATCQGDYLQIGETRYCNKYAMTGHKMYLNFSEAATPLSLSDPPEAAAAAAALAESIVLLFHSDAAHTGRGFLIKYQQLLCESPSAAGGARRLSPGAKAKMTQETGAGQGGAGQNELASDKQSAAAPAKLHTLAPPLQQPDFSLALKTQKPPLSPSSGESDTTETSPAPSGSSQKPVAAAAAATTSKQLAQQKVKQRQAKNKSNGTRAGHSGASNHLSPLMLAESPTTTSTTTTTALYRREAPSFNSNEVQCNQVNHEMNFYLTSPGYASGAPTYANNLACLYYVRRNSSKVCYLEMSFLTFDLEPDLDCRYDFLEINNVRLCGSLKQETTRIYLFEEPLKLIKFKSDSLGVRAGFLIKVEQLECAPNGSILRAAKRVGVASVGIDSRATGELPSEPKRQQQQQQQVADGSVSSPPTRNSTQFEYDDASLTSVAQQTGTGSQATAAVQRQRNSTAAAGPAARNGAAQKALKNLISPAPSSGGADNTGSNCDDVLYGSEITIRSPHWPESYANDESLNGCKYTILRNNYGAAPTGVATAAHRQAAAICQLELRFVHLRLGFSDCLDIGGLELLCGFNARNLVKYYPFGERQTHLTITFTTGAGLLLDRAKLFGRSATPPYSHQLNGGSESGNLQAPQNHSDLLPSSRAPMRFMILVRQLECIDDFLAPQVELDRPVGPSSANLPPASHRITNSTNLLYSTGELAQRPRYVNRTAAAPEVPARFALSSQEKPLTSQVRRQNETQLSYDQPAATNSNSSSSSSSGVLMYSFADSLTSSLASFGGSQPKLNQTSASSATTTTTNTCLIQFNQYNGILASSNIMRAQLETQQQPQQLLGECEIRLKLLPGFCKVQLTFGEFDLYPARAVAGAQLCSGEYLELAGVQYCGQELRDSTRVLATTLPSQRHLSLRAKLLAGHTNSFRAIFKQMECDLEPLKPLLPLPTAAAAAADPLQQRQPLDSRRAPTVQVNATTSGNQAPIDFREISIREEFFELDSAKLAKRHQSPGLYEPNMFIIYKIKRASPGVCKLRLMFYKFDLEPPGPFGCKRDFLDINNQDRLCGSMDFRFEESSREYEWPTSVQDFQVSFVSDAYNQRPGFHIFGQQVADPASCMQSTSEGNKKKKVDQQQQQQSSAGDDKPQQPVPSDQPEAKDQTQQSTRAASGAATREQVVAQTSGSSQRQLPANCSMIINGERHFELASPNWPQQYDGTGSCHYLVRRAGPEVCSVTLTVNSLILNLNPTAPAASGNHQFEVGQGEQTAAGEGLCNHLSELELAREDYLNLDGRVKLCGLLTRPRSFKLDFANSSSQLLQHQRQFVVLKFVSNAAHGFGFHLEARQNNCETSSSQSDGSELSPSPAKSQVNTTGGKSNKKQNQSPQNQSFDTHDHMIIYDDSPAPAAAPTTPTQQGENTNNSPEEPEAVKQHQDGGAETGAQDDHRQHASSLSSSCNRLLMGEHNLIESDNFPGYYANNLECVYAIRRLNQSVCAIDLVFNYFELEPPAAAASGELNGGDQAATTSTTCESDYLEIDYSRYCGAYPAGHRVRFNYFGQELDKIVRFRSDAAKSRPGFSIVASQVTGDDECQSLPAAPPSGGRDFEQASKQVGGSGDQREVINYLPDSTGSGATAEHDHAHQSHANSSQPSSTLCQFSYHSTRQVLVSPGYNPQRGHYDNNLDCQYKLTAASYDYCSLRLTFLDLDLEQSPGCLNDYLLVDNRRYCGQLEQLEAQLEWRRQRPLVTSANQHQHPEQDKPAGGGGSALSLEIEFDVNLPRELDLLFHTDGQASAGRGFRLLAEQVPCGQQPAAEQEFKVAQHDAQSVAAARQARRQRFGQLAYPKNYVSSQDGGQQSSGRNHEETTTVTSGRAWHDNRPKMTIDIASEQQQQRRIERMSSGRAARPRGQPRPPPGAIEEEEYRTISTGDDDLRLSKEIVVSRPATPAPAENANR